MSIYRVIHRQTLMYIKKISPRGVSECELSSSHY